MQNSLDSHLGPGQHRSTTTAAAVYIDLTDSYSVCTPTDHHQMFRTTAMTMLD